MGPTHPIINIGTAAQLPTSVNQSSNANLAYAADLGKTVLQNGRWYRLVKAAAAIASASGMCLVTALDSDGVPTWVVNTTTTAANPLLAGVVPYGQTGSTGTTGLVSGDYFYVQVSGPARILCADNSNVGDALATTTTAGVAGEIGNQTTFLQTDFGAVFAIVIKNLSQATTNAAAITAVRLINLI